MRIVFDTNVTVSAAFFAQSVPGRAYLWALRCGELLVSLATLDELNELLSRPKFASYIIAEERERFLEALVARATLINVSEPIQACRNPKDDKFLELAVSGQATCIVSGDKDLLVLNPFRGVEILSPQEFLKRFASPG